MRAPVLDSCGVNSDLKILNRFEVCQGARPHPAAREDRAPLAGALQTKSGGGDDMGYVIAWLLGVPVTLLVLFWLFFGR
jgi:hypothetical protein